MAAVAIAACETPEPRSPASSGVSDPGAEADSEELSLPAAAPAEVPIVVPTGGATGDLSAALASFRAEGRAPAIGAAVWRGQDLVAVGVSGVRRLGDSTPVTVQDQWHLGSETKSMTATLIGMYVEKGKIHFEDTVSRLFAGEGFNPAYANVTVEQLLGHRAGFAGETPSWIQDRMYSAGDSPGARASAARAFLAEPPAPPPGNVAYSNASYRVLGAALERLTGRTWESLIKSDLFNALHMTTCGFGPPGRSGGVDEPWGHRVDDGRLHSMDPGLAQADNPPALGPAGTVHCSLEDWGKYLTMHLAGARGERTLLSAETMVRLHTPPPGAPPNKGYAGGWWLLPRMWNRGKVLFHTGSNNLWYASAYIGSTRDLVFAAVANRGGDPMPKVFTHLMATIIKAYTAPKPS